MRGDDDEIVGLFSPQRRLFRKSKAAVLFRAKVSYRLIYILHESAMTPTHSSLGILTTPNFNELRADVKLVMINGTLYFLGLQYFVPRRRIRRPGFVARGSRDCATPFIRRCSG